MIREANEKDIKKIVDIYNDAILHSSASFEEVPLTLEEGRTWLQGHKGIYPMLVFEKDSEVMGYVSLSPFGKKRDTAYYITAELSLYIDKKARGMGLGKKLMKAIIERAYQDGTIETIVSIITDGNAGSIALHERMDFMYGGKLVHVARKKDQLLDILFYQYRLID